MRVAGRPKIVLAYHTISRGRFISSVKTFLRGGHACDLEGKSRPGDRRRGGGVAITFDDGHAEMVEIGADVAKQEGWPIVFYLPTDYLDGKSFWPEELSKLVRNASPGTYSLFGDRVHLPDARSRDAVKSAVIGRMLSVGCQNLEAYLLELRRVLDPHGRSAAEGTGYTPISWARATELAMRPEITFGSHSVTHRPLGALDEHSIRWEFSESKRRIESHISRPVQHFCYPFGGRREIGTVAPKVVGDYYRTAVTLSRGVVSARTDNSWIPRIDIYESDTAIRCYCKLVVSVLA